MATVRVRHDEKIQTAIIDAASAFEKRMADARSKFDALLLSGARLIPTKRKIHQEMYDGSIPKGDRAFFTNDELKHGIPV